jgi:putative flavoprotein involved in K+ transport
LADLKLARLLEAIDEWAARAEVCCDRPPERFEPTGVPRHAPLSLDLRAGEIRTIVWATGFRPDLSWLDVPVLNRKGQVVHDGGVTPVSGLYLLGMPFLRRRKSSLIDGAAADARELTAHLAGYLSTLGAGNPRHPATAARPLAGQQAS